MLKRTKVFISYSHADKKLLPRLQVHLKSLEMGERIEWWADTKIEAGSFWRDDIQRAIDLARVAVLLISADFYASEFIREYELPPILMAAKKEGLKILAVIVGPSDLSNDKSLSEFQVVNEPSRPLRDLKPIKREYVWQELILHIKKAFSEKIKKNATQPAKTRTTQISKKPGKALIALDMAPAVGVFINRNEYVKEIGKFFTNSAQRLVVIEGLPGIGKTTLGAKLTYLHKHEFKGIFWMNCKADEASADILFSKLSQFFEQHKELGLRGVWKDPQLALEIKINNLIYALNRNKYLLILDDFQNWLSETLQIKSPALMQLFIKTFASAHQSKIILITKEHIPFDPSVFKIPIGTKLERTLVGFDKAYSFEFLDTIGFNINNKAELSNIIEDFGGSPYMLQVLSFLANELHMDIDSLLTSDEIRSRSGELLQSAIETLSIDSRQALAQFSVFRIPLSIKQLKVLDPKFDIKIRPLFNKFFLVGHAEQRTYEISRLVQLQFKYELSAARLRELHKQAARLYYELRQNVSPQKYDDLKYAIEEAYHRFESADNETGAYTLLSIIGFLIDWGYIEVAKQNIKEILDRVSTPVIKAACYWYQGLINDLKSVYPDAFNNFNNALHLYRSVNNYEGEAETLFRIGRIYNAQNNFIAANELYLQCINICKQKGIFNGWAASLLDMGWNVQESTGDFEQALNLYGQSIAMARQSADFNTLCSAHRQVGFLTWTKKGDKNTAVQHYDMALQISETNNLVKETGAIYLELGFLYPEWGDLEKARTNCLKSIEIFEAIGNSYGLSSAYMNLARAYEAQPDLELAIEWYSKGRAISLSLDNPGGHAWALLQLAGVLFKQEKLAEARSVLLNAIELSQNFKLQEIIETSGELLARINQHSL